MAEQASREILSTISIGIGTYLSLAASLYFAASAARKTLLRRA